jgi:U4/U6.U5 tri-snRNP-associated protein 3
MSDRNYRRGGRQDKRGGWDEPDRRNQPRDREHNRDRNRDHDLDRRDNRDRDYDRSRKYRSRSRERRDTNRSTSRERDRPNNRHRNHGRERNRDGPREKRHDRNRDREEHKERDEEEEQAPPTHRRRDGDASGHHYRRSNLDEFDSRPNELPFRFGKPKSPSDILQAARSHDGEDRRRSASPARSRSRSSDGMDERRLRRHNDTALPTRSKSEKSKQSTMSFKVGGHAASPHADSGRSSDREDRRRDEDGDERGDYRGTPMEEDDVELLVEDDGMADMQAMMGFGGFGTTKNKKIAGNNVGYVRKEKKTEYRQYMNRVGGFNRPLSPSR